ncbi:MAG: ABC transporter ATP-binding protein, partial [Anaerolineales bacterium]|nr:ABC transporter ATP-binding protein [Anaerolineales bacterium]
MVAIARALMTNPKMLVLDEPSDGLAPLILNEIGKTISLMCQLGVSVILVEQNVPFALQLVDRVYVMNKGRISFDGHANILKENTTLLHRYLGI